MEKAIENKKDPRGTVVQTLVLLVLVLLPLLLGNKFYIRLVTEIIIYGLLAMSLDVLLGFTGLLSFMHAAYMGIGAYTVAIFLSYVDPGASMWITFPLAIGVTALLALCVGWLQVRTGGFAFALLTVAFGMMYYTLVWKARSITCGDDGLCGLPKPDIALGPLILGNMSDSQTAYYFTLAVVVACFFATRRIMHSPFGAVLESIRENEERASFIGINVRNYKLMGWMLACTLAGVSGVLFTYLKGSVSPSLMDSRAGGIVLMMTLLGGMGTLWGSFIGAAVYIFLQDFLSAMMEDWMVVLGLAVILLTVFMPKGLADLPIRLGQRFSRKRPSL